ncbi:2-oxoacid:acceptor oxidoreductase [Anaerolineaceae bacterium oral taxon 439]|nr:2-oxoacid:acceptor oxidoreductase [Anaerolineaceae bacterium oral taxon 439]
MGKYLVKFDKDRCKSCDLCVSVCPKKILRIDPDQMNLKGFHPADIFDQGACIGCAQCAMICPDSVISVYRIDVD